MASRYNRKSDSSDSRARSSRSARPGVSREPHTTRVRSSSRKADGGRAYTAQPGGRYADAGRAQTRTRAAREARSSRSARTTRVQQSAQSIPELSSVRVGDINRADRAERAERIRKKHNRYVLRIFIVLFVIAALAIGWAVLYNSDAFKVQNINVKGVEHLTNAEMTLLADVPEDTTLLRVDADTICNRLKQNAWVQDATINRVFPDTLEIVVTERTITAVVEIPGNDAKSVKQWAIASDHMWLMPIPSKDSEAGKATSEKIYEDAESVLHITDVPYGTSATIGQYCTDSNVNNALDIVAGLTTELSGQVVSVSAAGAEETTLTLNNGVEIAFGKAENIRDKERVVLEILEENPDSVSYINVRSVSKPTWRSL